MIPQKRTLYLAVISSVIFALGCTQQIKSVTEKPPLPPLGETISVSEIQPAQVNPSTLLEGLSTTYYLNYFKRDVRYLQKMHKGEFKKVDGKPILQLNNQFHRQRVFDSGVKQGVAVRMKGYLHFEQTGLYRLQAVSNDGIVLLIVDKLVLSDPKQHPDRLSNIGEISVSEPGWFPVKIDYFQRKGTAALKLFWKKPGDNNYLVIPASAYRHTRIE